MKNALTIVVLTLTGMVIGCAPAKKPAANGAGVLDVKPTSTDTVALKSVTVEPLPSDSISYSRTPSPASTAAHPAAETAAPVAAATTGSSYKIKRGDTLYAIAKTTYGDGKQWQKIADNNPGLSPKSLRVGQTITLP